MKFSSLDIFCHIIDNFGDAGVVYRFCKEFKKIHPSCRIRLFCDNLTPLAALAPGIVLDQIVQDFCGIHIINSSFLDKQLITSLGFSTVLVEAFGCDIPQMYLDINLDATDLWINLEYLSAELWIDDYHTKQSLLGNGTTKKYFYMPGFTKTSGGVIIDSEIESVKPYLALNRTNMLNKHLETFDLQINNTESAFFVSIFTYQRGFDTLLTDAKTLDKNVYLFVCGEKSQSGMLDTCKRITAEQVSDSHFITKNIHILFMPFLSQHEYDMLLCLMDFNIVRGEDSWVRAICAEKPFLWNSYLQEDKYHLVKVHAFCDMFKQYFDSHEVFDEYQSLMMDFNNIENENSNQTSNENYLAFFRNLNKIEHSTKGLCYFMRSYCDLMQKFSSFLLSA